MAPEFAGLVEAVLSSGGVENQEDIVRRAGDDFGGRAFHFVQLGHQIGFRVQASGGVHDDHVGGMSARGRDRVKDDGGGIGARFLFYDFHAGTVRPDFQLLDGCRAESVSGAEDYARAFFFQAIGELADGCCLAGAVHADDEDDARSNFGHFWRYASAVAVRVCGGCLKNFYNLTLEFFFQLGGFGEFVFVYLLAQGGEDFFGGAHADVRAEQSCFEMLQQFRINRTVAGENLFNLRGEFCPRFGDGFFQALKKRRFRWSEERNHDRNRLAQ